MLKASLVLMACILALAADAAPAPSAPKAAPDFEKATRDLDLRQGFFDLHVGVAGGQALLALRELEAPFLMFTSLPHGLGSNDVGLDRGQIGEGRLVEFRRAGNRVLLVQRNTRFLASSDDPLERDAAEKAFAESVLWGADVVAERKGADPALLVDVAPFLTIDHHGVAEALEDAKQGKYAVDAARSLPSFADLKSFPDNLELEALLTFTGSGPGPKDPPWTRQVAPDAKILSVRQHVSFVRLPPPGFRPREFHPFSGGISIGFMDFAKPLSSSLSVRYQIRHRLERMDPAPSRGPVKKPIVYYLDPGTPEPVRSALLDGARWWASAFDEAGFEDAFRVEIMPAGMDAADARYNVIQWVHRATRGWSYGGAIVDPRTGEIIKGVVTLGSQRVRQDILIAEALLAPFDGSSGEAALAQAAQDMALARLRQLSAHEVGHTLGLAHDFAASPHGDGSVMDYPHPMLRVAGGRIALDGAYGIGVGRWDVYAIRHAYLETSPAREKADLAALRESARAAGLRFLTDADARSPGAADPDALLWDYGDDAFATFDVLMEARRLALARFSKAVLPPDRQLGEIALRLVPVYLMHRYQLEGVARRLGGASYDAGLAGDARAGAVPVSATEQQRALAALVRSLSAEELALPAGVLDLLSPPAPEHGRSRDDFATKTAPLFDALAAPQAAAAHACAFLFAPQRLNRVAWQHERDAKLPGLREVMGAVYQGTWGHAPQGEQPGVEAVQVAIDWVVLDALAGAIEGGELHPQVAAELRDVLRGWQRELSRAKGASTAATSRREAAEWISRWLEDPVRTPRRDLPPVPPGAPI